MGILQFKSILKPIAFSLSLLLFNGVLMSNNSLDIATVDSKWEVKFATDRFMQLKNDLSLSECDTEESIRQELQEAKRILKNSISELGTTSATASAMMMGSVTCPEMQIVELTDVPGFSQTNELIKCGDADTLSFLIFIEEPGFVSGTQMTLDFDPGMQYAGFELTHYSDFTSISNVNPNPDKPKFLLEGITDGVYVAYIGTRVNCDADIDVIDYKIDVQFNFIYEDTLGQFISCRQDLSVDHTYDDFIKEPDIALVTRAGTITKLGTEVCIRTDIVQGGLPPTYWDSVYFQICDLDLSGVLELTKARIWANGVWGPYYEEVDNEWSYSQTDNQFNWGIGPDHMGTDGRTTSNEALYVYICYNAETCPSNPIQNVTYKASYGCDGAVCKVAAKTSTIKVAPNAKIKPVATAELTNVATVCGPPAQIDVSISSGLDGGGSPLVFPQDSALGLYTDLKFRFEACGASSMEITEVEFSEGTLDALNFVWSDDDIVVDLSGNTEDLDGPGGIIDADGDGFFDDLAGGTTIDFNIKLNFSCSGTPDPSSLFCNNLDCSFAQIFIEGKRDCGQSFKEEPSVGPFDILYGATYAAVDSGLLDKNFRINFGVTGNNSACNPYPVREETVEFKYVFNTNENVIGCTDADNFMQIVFQGSPIIVYDVEFNPADDITVSSSAGMSTISNAAVTWTDIDLTTRMATIPLGDATIGDTVRYFYTIEADSAQCAPAQYMTAVHQVIERCNDCDCDIVKACGSIDFVSDPNDCSCPCEFSNSITDLHRVNLGYADKTRTSLASFEDVKSVNDHKKFLPGDTMFVESAHVPRTQNVLDNAYLWHFNYALHTASLSWPETEELELEVDAKNSELLGIYFKKQGGTTKTEIDFSKLASCLGGPNPNRAGMLMYFGETPYDDISTNMFDENIANARSTNENLDNSYMQLRFYNFDEREACENGAAKSTVYSDPSDCLRELIDTLGFEIGDTLFVQMHWPLIKNPLRAADLYDKALNISPQAWAWSGISVFDENDADCVITALSCHEGETYKTTCPDSIFARTNIEYTACGGSVEHLFYVVQPAPLGYFSKEWRPYYELQDIEVPIYSPLVYCSGARAILTDGTEIPLTVKETTNHTCTVVNGTEYCTVSSGNYGTITFNPYDDGYEGLAIGLTNLPGCIDTLRIVYDLCKVCEVDINTEGYSVTYDYKFPYEPPSPDCYVCHESKTGTGIELLGCADLGEGVNYYNELNLDTLVYKNDRVASDVFSMPISTSFPSLSTSIDLTGGGANVLASDVPGTSVEKNFIKVCTGTDGVETHLGVVSSFTIPNSVLLDKVFDDAVPPNEIVASLVSTSALGKTYAISLPNMPPDTCVNYRIGTTLLFCPEPPQTGPEICVSTTSGCLDPMLLAALAPNTSPCNNSQVCYVYTFGETGLQGTFITPNGEYSLCDTIPFTVLIKNTNETDLTDITLEWDLPIAGIEVIPNSFETSYPNCGEDLDAEGNVIGTFLPAVNPPAINGNNIYYAEDNDWSPAIHAGGLPNLLDNLSNCNSYAVIRFKAVTTCDEFVSGSRASFRVTAKDPCGPGVIASQDLSDPIIITGAHPDDFAQILVTAKPTEAYCNATTSEFTLTGQNISEVASGDSVQFCLTFPDNLVYQPGTANYVIPASQSVGTETITTVGNSTLVCFAGYNNMPVGGQFTIKYEAEFADTSSCGDYKVGVDIKELVEDVSCPSDPTGACDVFVQTSVNPEFTITLKGPMEVIDLKLLKECTDSEDPVTISYEFLLHNPGPDYPILPLGNNIHIALHDDVLADGVLDYFDPILDDDNHIITIGGGDTILVSGTFVVDAINACPVILKITFDTDCACDNITEPLDQIEPAFFAELPPTTILCPGTELGIGACGEYDLTYDPASNVIERMSGDSVYVSVVDPNELVTMTLTGMIGECEYTTVKFLRGFDDFDMDLVVDEGCENQDLFLELTVPTEYQTGTAISWSPATYLDDANRLDPIFNGPEGSHSYDVTLVLGDGCVKTETVSFDIFENGLILISGDTTFCYGYQPATINASGGFDYYEWYKLDGGFEILQQPTFTNTWSGPTEPGKYIVKGYNNDELCPSISTPWMVTSKECVDLELKKSIINIPSPLTLGSQITYELEICNINDPSIGMIYDATSVMLADNLPANITYVAPYSSTTGTYTNSANNWNIGTIENGTCDTLLLDVTIDGYGPLKNTAQISSSGKDDIDSEVNNDTGDQSEDDEDFAEIEVDTFDLALKKVLSPLQTSPVAIGSTVTYDIEVCNQGDIDAYNVVVVDYVPMGMDVTDPNWTPGVSPTYYDTIPGPITPGNCETIQLTTTINGTATPGGYTNFAEIADAEDVNGDSPPDVDSTPDAMQGNDGPVTDNDVTGGGPADGEDEDDHDPATILVVEVECEIANNLIVCPETPLVLEEIGVGNTSWNWTGPNGFTSTDKMIVIDPPVAGTFSVTVTSAAGSTVCSVESIIHPEMQLTGLETNVSCKNGADGAIDLTIAGGTAPFTFDWSDDGPDSPDNDDEDASGLKAGKYTVTVQDANGCQKEATFNITEPTELGCRITEEHVVCNGDNTGSITVDAKGGTMPYSYSLNGAAYQPGNEFNELAAGDYTVEVKDANGCLTSCMITIKEPEALECLAIVTDNNSCAEDAGAIEIQATGGSSPYTFSIDGTNFVNSNFFSGLAAGNYTITVKDNNECTTECSATITEPSLPFCDITASTNISCNGGSDGSFVVDGSLGSGDYEFSIDGVDFQAFGNFNDLEAGTYTVIVRNEDSPSCTSMCTVTLSEPEPITCSVSGTDVTCNGAANGTITVSSIGGSGELEYSIDNGTNWQTAGLFEDLTAKTYTVLVRDIANNDCFSSCSFTIQSPTSISCTSTATDVLCNGELTGTIQVSGTGGTMPYEYSINGSAWQPGSAFINLPADNYTISVRDANLCIATCMISITEPAALSCSLVSTNLSDCIVQDGKIAVVPSGGTTDYTYSINGGGFQSDSTFSNLMAGTHVITIKDANGCTSTCEATLTAPSAPMCTISSANNILCKGETTGSITATGTGGSGNYQFSKDNTAWQNTGSFTGLSAGSYTIYIRNVGEEMCVSMCTVELTEPDLLTCSTTGVDVSCNGGNDGSATVVAAGGEEDYSYSWSDSGSQTSSTATGLTQGSYTVTVTDANGCTTSCSVTISQPSALTCMLSSTSLLCNGDTDAVITVAPVGGVGPYEYSLGGGPYQPGNTFSGLDADSYSVTVRDANDCISTCNITITEPTALSCSLTKSDVTDCLTSDGEITVTASGGTGTLMYSVDGGASQAGNVFEDLGPGTHVVTVTDANGCTTTCDITLAAPSAPLCNIIFHEDISCNGGSDGSITVQGIGEGILEYSINGGTFTPGSIFSGLEAGNYVVTVRIQGSPMCTSTCFVTLTEPIQLICSAQSFDISCNGGNDGSAMVTAQGGTQFYTYLWSNGSIANTATNLSVGNYTVTVTDANGCTTECSVAVVEPDALSFTTNITDVACNGDDSGSVIITADGGSPAYEYSLNGMGWQPGNVFTGLAAGSYSVALRDKNDCVTSQIISITEPDVLTCTATATDATDCDVNDGMISVAGTGGTGSYEYSIDGGAYSTSSTFTGLIPGTHVVMIKDENDCVSTCEATVEAPNTPMCSVVSVDHVDCFGESTGSIIVTGTGGSGSYQFSLDNSVWTNTNGIFTDLPAGVHNVYVRNSASPMCVSMCATIIEQPEELECLLLPNDPLCNGGNDGNITVVASEGTPGYFYRLNGGPLQASHVFEDLTAGSYTVTIQDANGCEKTCSVTLSEPDLLVCSTTVVDLLCNGDASGQITVTGTGGVANYDYNIDGGFWQDSNVFSGLSGGNYTVYIRDENDCVSTCNAIINEPPALECNLVRVVPESCAFNDGIIEISAAGGSGDITYSIDGGANTQDNGLFEGLTLGVYTITITDTNGCVETCVHEILPDCYDLALTKKLVTPGPYSYGQKVVFDIEVINQGNIDATNVEVTDHLPCGFSYDPSLLINLANNWTLYATTFPMSTIASLPAQTNKILQIEVTVEMCTDANGHVNVSEISEAFDPDGNPGDDVDSEPDYNPNNDMGGDPEGASDDQEDGNGLDDEDDHDPAFVPIYDVALEKEMITQPTYEYGQDIEFAIEVCNQSSPPISNVEITDHIPAGYSFDGGINSGWMGSGPTPLDVVYTITSVIQGGECVTVPIILKLEMAGGYDDWKNAAEVSMFTDEDGEPRDDVDSDEGNDDGDQSEDDEDSAGPEVVDASLLKTTTATGPFTYGDVVPFDIEVANQGNVDLYNIVINDFIPCGYEWVGANSPLWIYDSGTAISTTTIAGPIVPGQSVSITKMLKVVPCAGTPTDAWTNVAEIESFANEDGEDITDDDIDSDGDDDPTNDVTEDNVNDNTNGDEDDNDPETIEVFDLAQIKEIVTEGPYEYGQQITFNITVVNQGNVTAANVDVTDHLPVGYSFDLADNTGWDATTAPAYVYSIPGTITPGEVVVIPLVVTIEMSTGGADVYTNISEISGATDEAGEDVVDADSDPDGNPGDDEGGEPGTDTDNALDGNGTDDEDDHDPEMIRVVDAALVKTTTDEGPFKYGDMVTFDFEVFNQGNVDLFDIKVNDLIPCGYKYLDSNDPAWAYDANTSLASTAIAGPVVAGTSHTFSITVEVQPCAGFPSDGWTNISELESFANEDGDDITDEDIDSDGDDDPTNDVTEDNVNDNTNGDEDDNDPETIEVFDLAQIKEIVTEGPYEYGQQITFNITVVNQGNVTAANVDVTDHLPVGYSFDLADNTGWDATTAPAYVYSIPGAITPGEVVVVPLVITIEMSTGGADVYTNISEISGATDEAGEDVVDADSDPDSNPGDDEGGEPGTDTDNTLDGNGTEDEDDHDPEMIRVVDAALVKTTTDEGPFKYGDMVTFDFEVFNQGNVDLFDIKVNDLIPCGYKYLDSNDPSWAYDAGTGLASNTIAGPVVAGTSHTFSITVEVQPCAGFPSDGWTNISELESFANEDGDDITDEDIDSEGDDDPTNDVTEDNVNDNTNGDEDDNDPETIEVFDLAQIKEIVTEGPYEYGQQITFNITVVNQGNVTAANVDVTDHLPAGYSFDLGDNAGWDDTTAPAYVYTIPGTIAPGDMIVIPLVVTVQMTNGGVNNYTNISEISGGTDEAGEDVVDADSDPDGNPGDDEGGEPGTDTDNTLDGNGTDDEDDHDPEMIEIHDLALVKKISNQMNPSGFKFGDIIMYDMVVYNQGNQDAYNIVITDYIPSGYDYDPSINPGWVGNGPAPTQVSYTFAGPLAPGDSAIIMIQMTTLNLGADAMIEDYKNYGGISDFEDGEGNHPEDIDSTPDNDPTGDGSEVDDATDGSGGDEDDQDPALPFFMDLALKKTLAFEYETVKPGDVVVYNITVYNQGTLDAYNVEVTEYSPPGLLLSPSDPNGWDATTAPNYTNLIDGPLVPGDSIVVQIEQVVQAYMNEGDYINAAEISDYEDVNGDMPPDFDSEADGIPDNDGDMVDNDVDNTDGDEDDSDFEELVLVDLALKKVVNTTSPVKVGEDVSFTIWVFNQGNIPNANVLVSDYIPEGFLLSTNDTNGWNSVSASLATKVLAGPIAPLDSALLEILLTVQPGATLASMMNVAEISSFEDTAGNDISELDVDSDADGNPDNDGDMEDNDIDGLNEDEDDSDPAWPPVLDLALIKTTAETGPVIPGDKVVYNITVINQGNVDARSVIVYDYMPAGMALSTTDPFGWSSVDANTAVNEIEALDAGQSEVIQIEIEILPGADVSNLVNVAEIGGVKGVNGEDFDDYDIDSNPDDDNENDPGGLVGSGDDDNADGNGSMGEDEDDSDPAMLPVFDLALIKTVDPIGPYAVGDIATFKINVCNQGNITATDVEVYDYIPAGLQFVANSNNADWTSINANLATYVIKDSIEGGACHEIFIELELISGDPMSLVNKAEIATAFDTKGNDMTGKDVDSLNDGIDDENPGEQDDNISNQNGRAGGDEDDHDFAAIYTCQGLACVGNVNLSLDQNCEGEVNADMFLADNPYGTGSSAYDIVIKDEHGHVVEPLSPNTQVVFTFADVGKTFTYSISVPFCNDNSCWGEVTIESKVAPRIECSRPDTTITCIELARFPGPPVERIGCYDLPSDSLEILDETITEPTSCEGDLIKTVTRTYQAVDVNGNRSNVCVQEMRIVALDTDNIIFPPNNSVEIQCTEEYLTIDTLNPTPDEVPYYYTDEGVGFPLYPLPKDACNIFVDFSDETIYETPCKTLITRTWTVQQWHCNEEYSEEMVQLVSIIDTVGPTLVCPDTLMTVSTNSLECLANITLPEIIAIDSCNTVKRIDMTITGSGTDASIHHRFYEDQNGGAVSLPVGLNLVTYTAYDECHNSNSCTVQVRVVDETPPVIICQKHTVVSLTNKGETHVPASVFDDGSYDGCGPITLKVRRMELSCQVNEADSSSIEFSDYAIFCCEDVGEEVLVVLRAYDENGMYNECMVEVRVDDKNVPTVVAPPNITVSCDFVFDNEDLSVFGEVVNRDTLRKPIVIEADSVMFDGLAIDGLTLGSCLNPVLVDVDRGGINSCGLGRIVRIFSAELNGVTVRDTQVIRIINTIPFDPDRIVWPKDTTLTNVLCTKSGIDPNNLLPGYDEPILVDGTCELVGISISNEEIYDAVLGADACYKLLRTWSVIDWCDRDELGAPMRWDSVQVIKVENTSGPEIDCPSTAETFNSFDADCNPVMVSLSANATDDCTPSAQLYWTWQIDLNADGDIDTSGVGNKVDASYVPGLHKITWYAEDLCGNVSEACIQDFEITNDKSAPAICIDNVVTTLNPMDLDGDGIADTGMVEIWASDIAKDGTHPCGHEVLLSFDQAGLEVSRMYTCEDLGLNPIELWVTDLVNGAQSHCSTVVDVQDNSRVGVCSGSGTGLIADISGLITTEQGEQVENAEVRLEGSEFPHQMTDDLGMYAFENMPQGGQYKVVPEKDVNHINGVSTLDLVMIQQHVLGIKVLDSPYKIIASDINNSGNVSAIDIVELRKLILGDADNFTNNNSWRFIDENYEFTSPTNPLAEVFPEEFNIASLDADKFADFVAVKVGDVSGNANGSELVRTEIRNSNKQMRFIAEVNSEDMYQIVEFKSEDFVKVNGFQTSIEFDAMKYEFVNIEADALPVSLENVGTSYSKRGIATLSWHSEEKMSHNGEEVLFRLYFKPLGNTAENIELSSSSAITVSEAYLDGEVTDNLSIEMQSNEALQLMVVNQNEPNPWVSSTTLNFELPDRGEVQIRIFDNNGKLVHTIVDSYSQGYNELVLNRDYLTSAGIYMYEVQFKEQIEHKRMIVLD